MGDQCVLFTLTNRALVVNTEYRNAVADLVRALLGPRGGKRINAPESRTMRQKA